MSREGITRRNALTGAATVGVGLPLLAACGGGDDTTGIDPAGAGGGSSSSAGGGGNAGNGGNGGGNAGGEALTSTSDIPVGGGTIFADESVVVTQPTEGEFKASRRSAPTRAAWSPTSTDGSINCTCHGSKFSIADGSVLSGPATSPLPAVDVTVRRRPDQPGLTAADQARPAPPLVARRAPPVEPRVEQDPGLVEPVGAQQRGDPGLLDDLALRVGPAEPPAPAAGARPARRRPRRAVPAGHQAAARRPAERPPRDGSGGGARRPRREAGSSPAASPTASSATAACMAEERRRRPLQGVAAGDVGDPGQVGDVGGVRGERPAEEQRAGVDQRPAAQPVLGTQLRRRTGAGPRRGRRARARAGRRARRSG